MLSLNDALEEMKGHKPTPKCCRECKHLDWDISDWDGRSVRFCELNIFLPTAKGTCKKQEPK